MKLQAVLLGLGLVGCVVTLDHVKSPGNSDDDRMLSGHRKLTRTQACMPNCWDNSKYVSPCTKPNETLCLCDDAQFQNVGRLFIRNTLPNLKPMTDPFQSWFSNASTPSALQPSSALPCTTLYPLAEAPILRHLMPYHPSSVTRACEGEASQLLALLPATSRYQLLTQWRVVQSAYQPSIVLASLGAPVSSPQ